LQVLQRIKRAGVCETGEDCAKSLFGTVFKANDVSIVRVNEFDGVILPSADSYLKLSVGSPQYTQEEVTDAHWLCVQWCGGREDAV